MLISCTEDTKSFRDIDIQGHRGARGLMPENTIPGFIKALDLGVNTLEMDVVITSDSEIVVSHEPFMNFEISTSPSGIEFPEKDQLKYNIYKMTFDEVTKFDVGIRVHPRFLDQEKIAVHKPLLLSVIDTVDAYTRANGSDTVNFNIEIKSMEERDNIFNPEVSIFSDLVYQTIDGKIDWSRVTIQSFDFRVLHYFNEKYPNVTLALLIENEEPWKSNIDSLGFTPEIYSCYFQLLSSDIVSELQMSGMKVIPWTVNERSNMDRLLEWGVDGIITDYPDRTKD